MVRCLWSRSRTDTYCALLSCLMIAIEEKVSATLNDTRQSSRVSISTAVPVLSTNVCYVEPLTCLRLPLATAVGDCTPFTPSTPLTNLSSDPPSSPSCCCCCCRL